MKDFILITKDDVLPRLMNDDEVYAFVLTLTKNGVTACVRKLKNETLGVISKIENSDNVVFYVKKYAREL